MISAPSPQHRTTLTPLTTGLHDLSVADILPNNRRRLSVAKHHTGATRLVLAALDRTRLKLYARLTLLRREVAHSALQPLYQGYNTSLAF
jgi:hypothetical protein